MTPSPIVNTSAAPAARTQEMLLGILGAIVEALKPEPESKKEESSDE